MSHLPIERLESEFYTHAYDRVSVSREKSGSVLEVSSETSEPQWSDDAISVELKCDPRDLGLTHLDQYFGPWAVHEARFLPMVQSLNKMDFTAHVQAARVRQADDNRSYELTNSGIAIIELSGTMTKRGSSFSGGGTMMVRRQIRQAMRDDAVRGIMLSIESPGGAVSGTKELADDVASAARQKPVHVYIEDIGASAAYYVASQAGRISANEPAFVGSIGTFMVIYDVSRAYENAGIKVNVIRSGSLKGAGTPGSAITDEQAENWQSLIDKSNQLFLSAVQSGRSFSDSELKKLATGQVWIASDAQEKGLIDAVETFEQALSALEQTISQQERKLNMSQDTKPQPATSAELRAACPGATSDFILAQLEAGATIQNAQAAFIAEQQKQVELAQKEAEEAKAKAEQAEAASKLPGNQAVQTDHSQSNDWSGGGARAAWKSAISEKTSRGMSNQDAAVAVDRENPGLREAMVAEYVPREAPQR